MATLMFAPSNRILGMDGFRATIFHHQYMCGSWCNARSLFQSCMPDPSLRIPPA
jgi:hypothetical protein